MSLFCREVLCVLFSFSIILLRERELAVLLFIVFLMPRDCYCYLPLPRCALAIVAFPGHTHLLSFSVLN